VRCGVQAAISTRGCCGERCTRAAQTGAHSLGLGLLVGGVTLLLLCDRKVDLTRRDVLENFRAYGLPSPDLIRMDNHLFQRHFRSLRPLADAGKNLPGATSTLADPMGVSMFVCMFVCMYVCVYVCMYVCVYVCVYVCMYVC